MPRLKEENNELLLQIAAQMKPLGWQYTKTGTVFKKQVCKAVTLQVNPNFFYTCGGLVASSQPQLYLRSRTFEIQASRIYNLKTQGPCLLSLNRAPATLPGFSECFESKFTGKRVQFLQVEEPKLGFTSDKGYFENDALPSFIRYLLAFSDHFLIRYKHDNELDVLRAMPQTFSYDGPYGAIRLGQVVPFALTQLLAGRSDVLETLRSTTHLKLNPTEDRLLSKLEDMANGVVEIG